jgi:hypothetical protein
MPGPGANDPRRPFPNFSLILSDVPMGANNYQGLETKYERRFTRGFSTLLGYTWSHTMMGDIGQNTQVIAPEKMLSPEDLRQRFFSTAVWDLPFGQGRAWVSRGVLGRIVGGWQFAANFAAQTGLPQLPGVGTNTANTTGIIRPDRLRDGNLPRGESSPERWFDRTAFALPAAFQFGNSGAWVIEGPGLVNLDTTLSRQFVFGERWRLQFRTEFFNLLNEALFDAPNMLIDRPVGGAISTTVSPARQIQFALKLMW